MHQTLRALSLIVLLAACGAPDEPPFELDGWRTEPPIAPPPTLPSEDCTMALMADFQGLWTNPNPTSKVPPGATRQALNVISNRQGTAEVRAGQDTLPNAYPSASERLLSGCMYHGYAFEHTGTALYRRDIAGGTLTKVADNAPALGQRMRFAVAGDDLYMATSQGVRVMDGPLSAVALPGVPRAPDAKVLYIDGTNGLVLPENGSIAYRWTFVRLDADGREIEGAPSGRLAGTKTGTGTATTSIDIPIPSTLTFPARLRVYRTLVSIGAPAGDVMFLAAERNVTAADGPIVFFQDTQPEALLGQPLYTNSTSVGGGIDMANNEPPLAREIVTFDGHSMLGDVTYPATQILRIIGLPADNTTITIAGRSYLGTLASSAVIETDYVIEDSSALTISQQIEATARNLLAAVNSDTGAAVVLSYLSGENDPPGILGITAKTPTLASFDTSISGSGDKFEPPLTSTLTAYAERRQNGIAISKFGLPYAFPSDTAYNLRLGDAGSRILRIMSLRESLYVFKEDGTWKVWNTGQGWAYQQISSDVVLLVPDSLAVLDNQIYAWTTRGLVTVDGGGITEIDVAIKNRVQAVRDLGSVVLDTTFAVADHERLRYYLWHPSDTTDTYATRALVYNLQTDTWTERDDGATGGYVDGSGRLYLGSPTSPTVTQQRNSGTASDYQGPGGTPIPVTIDWLPFHAGNPGGLHQFTELRLITEEPTTGPYPMTFTNDWRATEECVPEGEGLPMVRVWVPDGCQRTSRLGVKVQRDVLEEYLVILGIADSAEDYNGPPFA